MNLGEILVKFQISIEESFGFSFSKLFHMIEVRVN